MKTILIQNYHPAGTRALIDDFTLLGFKVVMPDSNWEGKISYYYPNNIFDNADLITYEQFKSMDLDYILIACYEQQDDFLLLSAESGAEVILHVATNNPPYKEGISNYLLSPDIQAYMNLKVKNKMLYFPQPRVKWTGFKDYKKCFDANKVNSFIHYYQNYWACGYSEALDFQKQYKGDVKLYGYGNPDGVIHGDEVHKLMSESTFTLNFKEKDAYGFTVLESMMLHTPVISLREYIQELTLGVFFLDHKNSIIVDNAEEAINAIEQLTPHEYEFMARRAFEKMYYLTNITNRLQNLSKLLKL